ncbi:hypothetical protein MTBLM5_140047 [Magnetospirillum sp. LM-5]|uniref:hypothetical protein n=1 Tax=Magnetospirillum sp. LM-5 TaxID=2681466 RepID=UPI00137CE18C|nr:hypothetical protein [Magnetospirillum sp. LM-5]CAA7614750.1 hypothetical protein MTBLM5_140047 [Magnetospirillum sp. LM-5]
MRWLGEILWDMFGDWVYRSCKAELLLPVILLALFGIAFVVWRLFPDSPFR